MNNYENPQEIKQSFVSRLSNIWYHYKWAIIIALGFVVALSVAFVQSVTKVAPDAAMLYAGTQGITATEYDKFKSETNQLLSKDYNGDGVKNIDIVQIIFYMFSSEDGEIKSFYNPSEQVAMKQRFDIELATGHCVIYILDKALYNGIKDMILPLEEALGYVPEYSEDGYCIELSDLPAFYHSAFSSIPDDNVICVRRIRKNSPLGKDDDTVFYNNCISVFKDIVEYK
jgi:hypothetical protein